MIVWDTREGKNPGQLISKHDFKFSSLLLYIQFCVSFLEYGGLFHW